jgi:arabinogalactan endo-1,4-beta-galactosidase
MALTKTALRERVLRHMSVTGEDKAASAYEATVVDQVIDEVQAELEDMGLAYWETSAIPDAVARGLILYVAANCPPGLVGEERAAFFIAQEERGLRRIRRHCAKPNVQTPADYY